jgi:protein XagA
MYLSVNRTISIVLAAFLCIVISAGRCHAGAWTMEQGNFYERVAYNFYYADKEFDIQKEDTLFRNFRNMYLSNYIEYGITDRITFINAMYYDSMEKQEVFSDIKSNGFGDVDLGVKGKILEGTWGVMSTQALMKVPGAYDKNDALPLGNGQYDFDFRMLYGLSLYKYLPGYINVEMGYRVRMGDPSDEFRYLLEFGTDIYKQFYGRIKLDGILSMNNGSRQVVVGNPSATYNFDLGKLDMALGCRLTKSFGVEIGYAPEIYGKNTTQGATYTLALTYKLK